MKLRNEEAMALAIWGCQDYKLSIMRIGCVASYTIDDDMKHMLTNLRDRLITDCSEDKYIFLYKRAIAIAEIKKERQLMRRKQKANGIRRSLQIAKSRGWKIIDGNSEDSMIRNIRRQSI